MDTEQHRLAVAFGLTLQALGLDGDPAAVEARLPGSPNFETLPELYPAVTTVSTGTDSAPTTAPAILKLADGHYYFLSDVAELAVTDCISFIKQPLLLMPEVLSWSAYGLKEPTPGPPSAANETDPRKLYKVLAGESIWDIALRLNIPASELIEHNDLPKQPILHAGDVLHLPVARETPKDTAIKYVLLPEPKPMHITRPGGAMKWLFGNVRRWSDIKPSGPVYPDGKNLTIYMEAYVPVAGATAKYYMDANAVGDYLRTGRPALTLGFNHSHLADGHIDVNQTTPTVTVASPDVNQTVGLATPIEKVAPVRVSDVAPTVASKPIQVMDIAAKPTPNRYKTSYKWLNADGTADLYLAQATLIVHDHDNKRESVQVYKNKGVYIQGTFQKDGIAYGRPADAAVAGDWYGVPMHRLKAAYEDDDHDLLGEIPLIERVGRGRLQPEERYLVVPLSRVLSHYAKLKHRIRGKNTKE